MVSHIQAQVRILLKCIDITKLIDSLQHELYVVQCRIWYDNEVPDVTQYIRLMTIAARNQFSQCDW